MRPIFKKPEHKMKILKLTKKDGGADLYVNADKIVAFDSLSDGGTRIVFDEVFAYKVAEDVSDILVELTGCRKARA